MKLVVIFPSLVTSMIPALSGDVEKGKVFSGEGWVAICEFPSVLIELIFEERAFVAVADGKNGDGERHVKRGGGRIEPAALAIDAARPAVCLPWL